MPFRNLPNAEPCHFCKGDVLIKAGQEVTHLYYLIKGSVYREILSESGNETIITIKKMGSDASALVGLLCLYRKGCLSTSNFVAKTNCTCYKIPRESYLAVANTNAELLLQTIDILMNDQNNLLNLYHTKQEGNTASRLCARLLEYSHRQEDGRVISGSWSNVELAKFLGVHSVTVAKIIKVLKEEGYIERSKEGIVLLDCQKLEDYAQQKTTLSYRYKQ